MFNRNWLEPWTGSLSSQKKMKEMDWFEDAQIDIKQHTGSVWLLLIIENKWTDKTMSVLIRVLTVMN